MEKYSKPVMMMEEVEDEVCTAVATTNNVTVTTTAMVSGDVIEATPNQPVQTLLDPTDGKVP